MGIHLSTRLLWQTPVGARGDIAVLNAYLDGIIGGLKDLRPVWERIAANTLEPLLQENFGAEGEPVGGWEPLSDATLKRRRFGLSDRILDNTGRLRESFLADGAEHHYVADERSMEWGSDVPYGPYHQTGTTRMPQRPILFMNDEVIGSIERNFREYAEELLLGSADGGTAPPLGGFEVTQARFI